MKIKKKKYEEELKNQYWNGVQAGIKFALQFPEEANKYTRDTELLKIKVQDTKMLIRKLSKSF